MRKYPLPTKEEAEELRRLRQEAGMTIPQMAEALHTNQARISDYENGKRGTNPELYSGLIFQDKFSSNFVSHYLLF